LPCAEWIMERRMQFISRMQSGEWSFSECCRQSGISRTTGYEWRNRYREQGLPGLWVPTSAPHTHPNATPEAVVEAVLRARDRHPTWGPRKLMPLPQELPEVKAAWPVPSTIGLILQRYGRSVPRKKRRRTPPYTQPFVGVHQPNDEWSADAKGWFNVLDGSRCEPFTLNDSASRMVLRCQHVAPFDTVQVRPLFEASFREYGLPLAIRTDNGAPFASTGAGGLSQLSVWWIRLGILPQRIEPGRPDQNGRHERFHQTLKRETATPPAPTLRDQQLRLLRFREEYNHERPHEALGQRPPASVYVPSPRPYPSRLPELVYPDEAEVRSVRHNGTIKWRGRECFVSQVLHRETVGILEGEDGWHVWFGPIELGIIDVERGTLKRPKRPRRSKPKTGGTS
jgi:putative transposase